MPPACSEILKLSDNWYTIRMKNPLTSDELAVYKQRLTEELGLLETELNKAGARDPEHPTDWTAKPDPMDILEADENEVADALESLQENQSLVKDLEIRYREVAAALDRIKNGTYGICKISGKPIEKERLDANAAADTNIEHREDK